MFLGIENLMKTRLTSLYNLLLLTLQTLIIILCASAQSTPEPKAPNNSVSAIFVFGDSTSDPGNNNYIRTPFKSNFAPYGKDFPNHVATGRFCNGRLATDFIASYIGVKEFVPPYLNSSLSTDELMSGVSFASAGSGYDPLTPALSGLWDQGARKIAVAGVPPMGCLPIVITMTSNNSISQRGCIESLSSIARDYNKLLQLHLKSLQLTLQDQRTKIAYIDIYSPLDDIVHSSGNLNYSFEEVSSGCCGTGYLETAYLCNPASYVCKDASKCVFWDSIHPTEMTYYLVFKALRPVIDYIIKD